MCVNVFCEVLANVLGLGLGLGCGMLSCLSSGAVSCSVREAGMSGLEELTKLVAAKEPALLTPEL